MAVKKVTTGSLTKQLHRTWGNVAYHTESPGREMKNSEYVKLCFVVSNFVLLIWVLSASLHILSKWRLGNIHTLIPVFQIHLATQQWFHFARESKLLICEMVTFNLMHIPLLCPRMAKAIDLLSSWSCSFIYPWSRALTLHVCISPWYVFAFLTL